MGVRLHEADAPRFPQSERGGRGAAVAARASAPSGRCCPMRRTFATALAAVLSVSGFVAVSNAAANAAPSAVPIAAPAAEKVFRPEKPPLDPKTKKPIALPRDKAGKLLSNVYHYNAERLSAGTSPGATQYAVLTSQHNPFRQTTAAGHTLWEMAVLDSAGRAVEIGW